MSKKLNIAENQAASWSIYQLEIAISDCRAYIKKGIATQYHTKLLAIYEAELKRKLQSK